MIGLKRLFLVMRRSGLNKMVLGFILFLCAASIVLVCTEPKIHNFGDGLWYCYVASMTIGFGDIVATNIISRIITIIVSVYGVLIIGMIPGVIVTYYTEYIKAKESDTISTFLEKLENLPDLQQEELIEISKKIKLFNKKR
ncbi:MAG: two pore domain potassium channel family protein [Ruminococcus sp.]|nr:two pore domain potassium channel family protein [Ruminococcus sp.]